VLASIDPPPETENVIVTLGGVPPLAVSGVAVNRWVPFAEMVKAFRPRVTLSRAALSGVAAVDVAKSLFPSELLANTLNW
jgi:hypothetical protein